MTKQLEATQVISIRELGFDAGKAGAMVADATAKAIALLKDLEGFDQEPIKVHFQIAFMAGYMTRKGKANARIMEEAEEMRSATGAGGEPKEGKPQRSPEWEAAYTAARQWWKRTLTKASVETTESRGGARERDTSKTETAASPDVTVKQEKKPTVPKATDRASARRWFTAETAIINAFCVHNKEHLPDGVLALCDDFRQHLLALLQD